MLVFPDFRDTFTSSTTCRMRRRCPPLAAVTESAGANSPDVKAAEAAVRQESAGVWSARSEYLPSVSFDYFYGIDANQFAIYNPEHQRLLGSAAQAQMSIPLWNWGATQSRAAPGRAARRAGATPISPWSERQLRANVAAFYAEAQTARGQVDSLKASLDLSTESLQAHAASLPGGRGLGARGGRRADDADQARNAYDDGLVRYRVALAALQTLTGTL